MKGTILLTFSQISSFKHSVKFSLKDLSSLDSRYTGGTAIEDEEVKIRSGTPIAYWA